MIPKINLPFFSKFNKVFFLLALILISFYYQYHKTSFGLPQSLHYWRQADCASFALMYYQDGMNFFEPKVLNVIMGEGNAVGECPILYYFVACLYKIFGPHEFIFRIVILLFFYVGLFALYNLSYRIIKDRFFSFIIPLLLFSSPLIMLFANNFLCDIPSLSLIFVAWNYLFKYKEDRKLKNFWFSMLFFALAALLKANAAISYLAIGAIFFIEINGWSGTKDEIIFVHLKKNILGFLFVLATIVFWYWWAIEYNDKYAVSFLGTKTWPGWPIWETTDTGFVRAVNGFFNDSIYIFFQLTYALVLFLLFFIHANRSKLQPFLYNIFLLLSIGIALFIFTFFLGVRDNIYYCINLMILPVFVFICSCLLIQNKYPKTWNSIVFRGIILVFLLTNVVYAKSTQDKLYNHGELHFRIVDESFSTTNFRRFMDDIGVKKTDKVISFPDGTPNASLYVIGRQGWSEYNIAKNDTSGINRCISLGAKYLIVNNASILPELENYAGDFVDYYDNMYVYKLGTDKQKNLKNRQVRIKADNGQFVTFSDKNLVTGDSLLAIPFYMLSIGKGYVALKNQNQDFISCDEGNGGSVVFNTAWLGKREMFESIKRPDNTVAFKASNGKYVSLKRDQSNVLKADADIIGPNETFIFFN